MKESRSAQINEQVALNEEAYSSTPVKSPLLLDCVVTPVQEEDCTCSSDVLNMKCKNELRKARYERNRNIYLARNLVYRRKPNRETKSESQP